MPAGKKKQAPVCRECHRVIDGEACAICGGGTLSTDWAGYLIIIKPDESEVARRMNIKLAGRYALKVR